MEIVGPKEVGPNLGTKSCLPWTNLGAISNTGLECKVTGLDWEVSGKTKS